IALVNPDIKRVLAYSTISQLGYMFLACGVGAFSAGIFHVNTHAYFKALLFLSAGSVMHALNNETNMMKMGGLKDKLPITYRVFLVGALALSGVPIFAGFFSKDEILWKTFTSENGGFGLWLIGAIVAGLTAFYTFRLIYLTFFGKSRVPEEVAHHIHESPKIMTVPLVILAVLSTIGGFVGIPHYFNKFEQFLDPVFVRYVSEGAVDFAHATLNLELALMAISVVIAVLGIGYAYLIYVKRPGMAQELAARARGLYTFLYNKWYVDELYDAIFVRPIKFASEVLLWRIFDIKIIDGLVNGVASTVRYWSDRLRRIETGVVQNYALSIVIGVVIIISYFILR
ncbi:MAG: NADH-quinone oxidoreductase subunit L, partial [Calditrichaeota bacterium]